MIVMKFGGTSVEDAAAMRRVAELVRKELDISRESNTAAPMVVVSACAGITNKLIKLAHAAASGSEAEATALLTEIKSHHFKIVDELIHSAEKAAELRTKLSKYFGEIESLIKGVDILGELTVRSLDTFSAYGELCSSLALAAVMNESGIRTQWCDARQILATTDRFGHAEPLWPETESKLRSIVLPHLEQGTVVLSQGFIGATLSGKTSTLGRGGSDYSAAIFGSILGATKIQIWTDVDGVLTTDPKIVPEAKRLRVMTFGEAAELAYFGAKVLHPSTIHPAVTKNIPVYVLNSKRPESEGTLITNHVASHEGLIKSIAFRRAQVIINMKSTSMLGTFGFMKEIFRIFADCETPVDMVSTSEVSVSVTIGETKYLSKITEHLREISEVDVEQGVALVCVVGDNLRAASGVAARIFSAIQGINVKMISQGASEINVGFAIAEEDLETAVRLLHREFFSEVLEREIFA
ncbi:MAG: lysine-sensitive aspartokinase 3 [Rhizobacter sp.]|nr:lysine-sensitive aspartokinase 3 [Chlorobiales bacterium]